MEQIKLSKINKEDIQRAIKKDGKIILQLTNERWYELERDIIHEDAQGGPLMSYINSILEE